jgi:hypothetical protein
MPKARRFGSRITSARTVACDHSHAPCAVGTASLFRSRAWRTASCCPSAPAQRESPHRLALILVGRGPPWSRLTDSAYRVAADEVPFQLREDDCDVRHRLAHRVRVSISIPVTISRQSCSSDWRSNRGRRGSGWCGRSMASGPYEKRSAKNPRPARRGRDRMEKIEQQHTAGPFAGPKPEPMTVPRGASRSNRRAHPIRLE